jgi:hypothetical protein
VDPACNLPGHASVGCIGHESYHGPVMPKVRLRLEMPAPEPESPTEGDRVYRPNHYARHKVEPVFFIGENRLDFLVGNVVKYVLRFDAKNGIEDLEKAKRYLEMLIKREKGDKGWSL